MNNAFTKWCVSHTCAPVPTTLSSHLPSGLAPTNGTGGYTCFHATVSACRNDKGKQHANAFTDLHLYTSTPSISIEEVQTLCQRENMHMTLQCGDKVHYAAYITMLMCYYPGNILISCIYSCSGDF